MWCLKTKRLGRSCRALRSTFAGIDRLERSLENAAEFGGEFQLVDLAGVQDFGRPSAARGRCDGGQLGSFFLAEAAAAQDVEEWLAQCAQRLADGRRFGDVSFGDHCRNFGASAFSLNCTAGG